MAFDGLVTRAVTLELADKIKYGKIEKIYQPDADELVFNIHTQREISNSTPRAILHTRGCI